MFYWKLLKESIVGFISDDMLTHAAAISYYTVFSLPAMLLIVLWTAAQFYKEAAVHEAIFQKITSLLGKQAAEQIMSTIEKLSLQEPTWLATVVGLGVLLFFATTVFDSMRTALNKIAQVKTPDSVRLSIWMAFRVRLIAFGLLLSISFLLLVSLMLDVILSTLAHYMAKWIGAWSEYLFIFDVYFLDFAATVLLFVLYFRYLPDVRLKWLDAFLGALLTAGLFAVGKSLIGMFISNNQVVDLYDAAGSLLALMLWVYYAAIIFLFGAIFTFQRVRNRRGTLP
jgi:membrane protein